MRNKRAWGRGWDMDRLFDIRGRVDGCSFNFLGIRVGRSRCDVVMWILRGWCIEGNGYLMQRSHHGKFVSICIRGEREIRRRNTMNTTFKDHFENSNHS